MLSSQSGCLRTLEKAVMKDLSSSLTKFHQRSTNTISPLRCTFMLLFPWWSPGILIPWVADDATGTFLEYVSYKGIFHINQNQSWFKASPSTLSYWITGMLSYGDWESVGPCTFLFHSPGAFADLLAPEDAPSRQLAKGPCRVNSFLCHGHPFSKTFFSVYNKLSHTLFYFTLSSLAS